jgi:hypothetical protein
LWPLESERRVPTTARGQRRGAQQRDDASGRPFARRHGGQRGGREALGIDGGGRDGGLGRREGRGGRGVPVRVVVARRARAVVRVVAAVGILLRVRVEPRPRGRVVEHDGHDVAVEGAVAARARLEQHVDGQAAHGGVGLVGVVAVDAQLAAQDGAAREAGRERPLVPVRVVRRLTRAGSGAAARSFRGGEPASSASASAAAPAAAAPTRGRRRHPGGGRGRAARGAAGGAGAGRVRPGESLGAHGRLGHRRVVVAGRRVAAAAPAAAAGPQRTVAGIHE